jgi:uncharacterized protein with NRDE domain
MCTLIALHRCVDRVDLVIAANRDEYFDRPSEGPALQTTPSGKIVAPRDVRAGGTWFGVNPQRVFVALTNRPTETPDPTLESRGHVVTDALAGSSAVDSARILAAIPAGRHNPFNALVSDGQRAFTLVYQEKGELRELEPGAHVVGNADPDDRSHPKIAHVLDQAERAAKLPVEQALDALSSICRQHDCAREDDPRGPLGDPCVHLDEYGTRSSFLLTLGARGEAFDRLHYADGPPCRTEYDDFTALLTELTQTGRCGQVELDARTGI